MFLSQIMSFLLRSKTPGRFDKDQSQLLSQAGRGGVVSDVLAAKHKLFCLLGLGSLPAGA